MFYSTGPRRGGAWVFKLIKSGFLPVHTSPTLYKIFSIFKTDYNQFLFFLKLFMNVYGQNVMQIGSNYNKTTGFI